jgi:plasmid stabilization system protein ParE
MSPYLVSLSARAARDVDLILAWLGKRSPLGAQRWAEALDAAKLRLGEDPAHFPLIPEGIRIRSRFETRCSKRPKAGTTGAIFTIVGDEVRILRIRRPAQRLIRGRDLPKP